MPHIRVETDSLGSRELPAEALYGAATLRGVENFDISSLKLGSARELLRALARIKHAAAAANRDIGVLPAKIADAIILAATEIEKGSHTEHFIVDLFEGSGGTSINMNVNEVVANRALQLIGEPVGSYGVIHPNDHVNLGQSTNDVVPSAVKLAVHERLEGLIAAFEQLADALAERGVVFDDVLRIGRTCLQAGQPMRLGQAFGGYAAGVSRVVEALQRVREEMLVLPLAGTAIGTGFGAAPGYREAVYRHLQRLIGTHVRQGENLFDAMQNADGFARVSSELRVAAQLVAKIASDLIILSSGPSGGVGEIILPPVQPGSSIMPGKVNPVLPMMMQQVAFAVAGHDATVSLAALHGQLEINHFEPVIASNLFASIDLLEKSLILFTQKCVRGIQADRNRSLKNLTSSAALATLFVPKLGYEQISKLVRSSLSEARPFIELAIERDLITEAEVMAALRLSTEHPG